MINRNNAQTLRMDTNDLAALNTEARKVSLYAQSWWLHQPVVRMVVHRVRCDD